MSVKSMSFSLLAWVVIIRRGIQYAHAHKPKYFSAVVLTQSATAHNLRDPLAAQEDVGVVSNRGLESLVCRNLSFAAKEALKIARPHSVKRKEKRRRLWVKDALVGDVLSFNFGLYCANNNGCKTRLEKQFAWIQPISDMWFERLLRKKGCMSCLSLTSTLDFIFSWPSLVTLRFRFCISELCFALNV